MFICGFSKDTTANAKRKKTEGQENNQIANINPQISHSSLFKSLLFGFILRLNLKRYISRRIISVD
jgi:hypothetical protein